MSYASTVPAAEQAIILWTFLGSPINFTANQARVLIEQIVQGDERLVARQLKQLLAEQGQKVKHVHCLELAAKLAGRRGWHDGLPQPSFEVYFAGFPRLQKNEGKFARFSDMAELISNAILQYTNEQDSLFVATVYRNTKGLMFQLPSASSIPATIIINLINEKSQDAWLEGVSLLLERVRRMLEETRVSGFLDGYFCATIGKVGGKHCGSLSVYKGGLELGSGSELQIFQAIELDLKGDFCGAEPQQNAMRCADENYYFSYEYSSLEPNLERSTRTLFHPETEELMRRYRRFKQRSPGLLVDALNGSLKQSSMVGIPESVSINHKILDARLTEIGESKQWLVEKIGISESALQKDLDLGVFLQIAKLLGLKNYNDLVALPLFSEAKESDLLQTVLKSVDEVRFILRKGIPESALPSVREACEDLAASRRLLAMKRAGEIVNGLDEIVFSGDAEEFLIGIQEVNCFVRVTVVPSFLHAEEIQEFPAIGRRAYIFVSGA